MVLKYRFDFLAALCKYADDMTAQELESDSITGRNQICYGCPAACSWPELLNRFLLSFDFYRTSSSFKPDP